MSYVFTLNDKIKKKKELSKVIGGIEDKFKMKNLDLKKNSNFKINSINKNKNTKIIGEKKSDLEDLKIMVLDSITDFKNSRGFLYSDIDDGKEERKIDRVKYDLFNYIIKKKK